MNSLEAYWFKDKETAVALAVDSSVSYLCVAAVYQTIPMLYNKTQSLPLAFSVSMALTLISLAGGFALTRLDKLAVPEERAEGDKEVIAAAEPAAKQGCGTLRKLGYGYLLLVISYACRVLCYNLFEFISSEYFQVRFGFDLEDAGRIISIPYLAFAIFTPASGYVLYRFGRKPFISKLGLDDNPPLIGGIAVIVIILAMCWLGLTPDGKGDVFTILPFGIFSYYTVTKYDHIE